MLKVLKKIEGNTVRATDGDIGKVNDFYFDAKDWMVRWAVVEMENRKVLLPPSALGSTDPESGVLQVNLTRQRVRTSPDWNADRPVSRQHEIDLSDYYDWPYYWSGIGTTGIPATGGLGAYPVADMMADVESKREEQGKDTGDPDLHSVREVTGYHLQARDGEIGKISDFVVDDESWRVMYLIADTGGWLTGRKVILSPSWIQQILWPDGETVIDLDRETIRNSPEYDPNRPIDRRYENELYRHYNRPRYW